MPELKAPKGPGQSHDRACQRMMPWVVWAVATSFYLLQYILRVSPSVMVPDLMTTFHVDAATVGAVGAAAYLAYALAQIPVGMALDQWGARRVLPVLVLVCSAGCCGFAWSPDAGWAKVARFMIGLGSAGGFLGCAKIAHQWFSPARTGLIMGSSIMLGTVGAICGGKPLAWFIQTHGWRESMFRLAWVGAALACLMLFVLREPCRQDSGSGRAKSVPPRNEWKVSHLPGLIWARLRVVVLCVTSWRAAFVGVGVYLVLSVVADMWGVTWLQQVHGFSRDEGAGMMSAVYMGLLVGSPLLPWMSGVLESRRKPLRGALVLSAAGWIVLFVWPHSFSGPVLVGILFLMGLLTGAQVIPFLIVADLVPHTHVAMATAFVNMVVMLTGSLLQYTTGVVLDSCWEGQFVAEGVRLYSPEAFRLGIGSLVVLMGLGMISLARMKETFPRTRVNAGRKDQSL